MDIAQLAASFERFQTAIVGVLGFAGVIIALIVNARLARRAREGVRDDERASIRAALVAEMKIIKGSLEQAIETVKKGEEDGSGGLLVPTDPMSDAYDALIPRIGALPPEEVGKVMLAYLSIREMRKNLVLIPGTSVVDQNRVRVPRKFFDVLKGMHTNLLPKLDEAINCLSR